MSSIIGKQSTSDLSESGEALQDYSGGGFFRNRMGFNYDISIGTDRSIPKRMYWTTLNKFAQRKQPGWENDIDPTLDTKSNLLIPNLLKRKRLRKTSKRDLAKRMSVRLDPIEVSTIADSFATGSNVGTFGGTDVVATSFDDDVIEPLFMLRGMDVFLTDDAEQEIGSHPWLIEQGLRDVPSFVLNFYTQWGNILVYYKMPTYLSDWDLKEDESDADDVKAIKVCPGTHRNRGESKM